MVDKLRPFLPKQSVEVPEISLYTPPGTTARAITTGN
jgi:hypothetical protein